MSKLLQRKKASNSNHSPGGKHYRSFSPGSRFLAVSPNADPDGGVSNTMPEVKPHKDQRSPKQGRVRPSMMAKSPASIKASLLEENKINKANHTPHFMMSTESENAHHHHPSPTHHQSPVHNSKHSPPPSKPPRLSPTSSLSGNLKTQQKHIHDLQQKRMRASQTKVGANAIQKPSPKTSSSPSPQRAQVKYDRQFETPESIKRDRDRLLKEKQQWLTHVKKENDILMSLLHDVRLGKAKVQEQMDHLTEERNEIKTLKMDSVVHRFERILSELPLGERGTFKRDAEPLENQHRTDGVHSLMCSIARRARAAQERAIQELVAAIKGTEEHFLQGGDITLKVHELKTMAEGINHSVEESSEMDDDSTKKSESSSADMPNSKQVPAISPRGSKRTSMFGLRKGISFKMNSTANVIAAMTNQQKEMDEKVHELEEEKDKWKQEYVSLRRKMMKMKVINAITKIGRDAISQNGDQTSQINFQRSTDFVIPDGTKGWDALPKNWKAMGSKCLKNHIRRRISEHVRTQWVQESLLSSIVAETSEHMQDIFGHMLYTTASSVAGRTASESNIQHLCEAVLNSLAMERELYPLLTMYLTYAADSPYITDRSAEAGDNNETAIEDEIKELAEIEDRLSSEQRSPPQAAPVHRPPSKAIPQVVETPATRRASRSTARRESTSRHSTASLKRDRRESFNPDVKFEIPKGDEYLYEGMGGLD